jgi:hypothetical protein
MELNRDIEKKVAASCKEMSSLMKFLGKISIIIGGVEVISVLKCGLLVAWIPIWIGIILLRINDNCREFSDGKEESLSRILGSIKTLFILLSVFTIIEFLVFMITIIFFLPGLSNILKMNL